MFIYRLPIEKRKSIGSEWFVIIILNIDHFNGRSIIQQFFMKLN